MRIVLRTFAAYREAIGRDRLSLDLPEGMTAGQVWRLLADRHPSLLRFPAPTRLAVNDEFVDAERALIDGDEVALIPPVSGGADTLDPDPRTREAPVQARVIVSLAREAIDLAGLLATVADPAAGAVVLFCGTVRDNARGRRVEFLEYEAYTALAEKEMRRIGEEAVRRWPLCRVAVTHRLGHLEVGETSVAIAVSAPHRGEAFEAGRFLIDTLKQTVPIWKKEVWGSGAEWIGSAER